MTPPDTPLKPSKTNKRSCAFSDEPPSTPPKRARANTRSTFRVPSSSASSDTTTSSPPSVDTNRARSSSDDMDRAVPSLHVPQATWGNSITISCMSADDVRSSAFYYDGQVVLVRVQRTVYSLSRSKLADLCGHFAELFSPSGDGGWSTWVRSFIKTPVYDIPAISSKDFERFLAVLEKFDHMTEPLPEDIAISLLRVAHALACEPILAIAKKRLGELWDGSQLPRPDSPVGETEAAIKAIALARQYNLPGMLKRAVYELLGDKKFRDALRKDPYATGLHHRDITLFFQIWSALGDVWRDFVLVAPCTDLQSGRSLCYLAPGKDCDLSPISTQTPTPQKTARARDRVSSWEHFVIRTGQLKEGADDLFRYDSIGRNAGQLKKSWCQYYLQERRNAWEEKRLEWWGMLEAWFVPNKS
ncbi:hypothetical protein K466DRAFT_599620 [Polyporus arcularius HHB13444]|uniref:BTB domain-containing protein n=1 Tax=Polyporus arcularius HHB13444 TaxID=1314778 RepID=A0A5C3PF73_9APHY|nr:hypothetical protein K466DRAFT_599620 [Polyporus arcularius HHB13444]